jgi:enoyl-CoA hydratase/carnithine racemase
MVEYSQNGKVAIFKINRPEAMGALNLVGLSELQAALIDFRDNTELLVGIITGTGEKVFSAGVDVKEFLPYARQSMHEKWKRPVSILKGLNIWKPLIAACNGLTIGGGLELALACDIMIASDTARFGLPEVKIGINPGGGGSQRLPRTVPRRLAAEMLFTGKTISAEEGYRIGLINKTVPPDRLMQEAMEMADEICSNAPLAVRYTKELMVRGADLPLEEALRLEDDITPALLGTEDFQEGIAAFSEKRKPDFKGC